MMGQNSKKQMLIYAPGYKAIQTQVSSNLPIRSTPENCCTLTHMPVPVLSRPDLPGPSAFGLKTGMQFAAIMEEGQNSQP
jgi:hypothetical protein